MTADVRELLPLDDHGSFVTLVCDSSGRVTDVRLRGELDLAVVRELVTLGQHLPAAPAVDIDLEGVSFMDSAGLQAVLDLRSVLAGRGCDVRVLTPRSHELRILRCAARLGWASQELRPLLSPRSTAPEDAA